jgi:hypothetical protein
MTLRTRNTITRIFTLCTALISIGSIMCFVVLWASHSSVYNHIHFNSITNLKSFCFKTNSGAAALSILLLMLYAPITGVFLFFNFEKTHSAEILYFTGFLLGCFLESARLLIPLFDLWNSHSSLLITSTRITFFGELFAMLCLLVIGINNSFLEAQDSAQTTLLLIIASLFLTMLLPVNTTFIASTMRVKTGFTKTIYIIRILFILASSICFYVTASKIKSKELQQASVSFLILLIGYIIEISADSLFLCAIGFIFMSIFTAKFVIKLHNYYMWK